MPHQRFDLQVDVSRAVPGLPGPLHLAATIHAPAARETAHAVPVIFAVPGGGYSRHYFDLQIAGHADHSEAEHHVARGRVVVTVDHLGVGESSVPDPSKMTLGMMGAAYAAAVSELTTRLREGRVSASLPKLPRLLRIGMGQSLGGAVSIITQAHHASFDAIAPLGYSVLDNALPQPTKEAFERLKAAFRAYTDRGPDEVTIAESSSHVPDFRYPFHWEDVPDDIVQADMGSGYPERSVCPRWGSPTTPPCAPALMSPRAIAGDAARVDVPVFIGLGERDVATTPIDEPTAFTRSRDITYVVVPRMAHMHNFAGTRALLWQRFGDWADMLAARSTRGTTLAGP